MVPLTNQQEEKLDQIEKNTEGVSWQTFAWIVGGLCVIFAAVIGWMVSVDNSQAARLEAQQPQLLQIQTQLAQVQTDLAWIKQALNDK